MNWFTGLLAYFGWSSVTLGRNTDSRKRQPEHVDHYDERTHTNWTTANSEFDFSQEARNRKEK